MWNLIFASIQMNCAKNKFKFTSSSTIFSNRIPKFSWICIGLRRKSESIQSIVLYLIGLNSIFSIHDFVRLHFSQTFDVQLKMTFEYEFIKYLNGKWAEFSQKNSKYFMKYLIQLYYFYYFLWIINVLQCLTNVQFLSDFQLIWSINFEKDRSNKNLWIFYTKNM